MILKNGINKAVEKAVEEIRRFSKEVDSKKILHKLLPFQLMIKKSVN